MSRTKIKATRLWFDFDVRDMCIRHQFYTRGNNSAYAKMLVKVMNCKPTTANLYKIAKDIYEHSEHECGLEIASIMFYLENEVVTTCFEIEET